MTADITLLTYILPSVIYIILYLILQEFSQNISVDHILDIISGSYHKSVIYITHIYQFSIASHKHPANPQEKKHKFIKNIYELKTATETFGILDILKKNNLYL